MELLVYIQHRSDICILYSNNQFSTNVYLLFVEIASILVFEFMIITELRVVIKNKFFGGYWKPCFYCFEGMTVSINLEFNPFLAIVYIHYTLYRKVLSLGK